MIWTKPWKKVLKNTDEPFTKWYSKKITPHVQIIINFFIRFIDGEINACYNTLDRHVLAGKGTKIALIYDSPLTKIIRRVTYSELLDKVSHTY